MGIFSKKPKQQLLPEPQSVNFLVELQFIKCNIYIHAKATILAALIQMNPNEKIETLIDQAVKAVDHIANQQSQSSKVHNES